MKFCFLVVLGVLFYGSIDVISQPIPLWHKLGEMEGGVVRWLDYQNGVVVAGTEYGGLALSYDDGLTWRMVPNTLDGLITSAMVRGDTIVVGNTGRGIGLSFDNGASWKYRAYEQIGTGTSGCHLISGKYLVQIGRSLMVSTDVGETWVKEVEDMWGQSVVIGNRVIASINNTLQYSDDVCSTWKQCNVDQRRFKYPDFGHMTTIGDTTYLMNGKTVVFSVDGGMSWLERFTINDSIRGSVIYHPEHSFGYFSNGVPTSSYDNTQTFLPEGIGLPPRYPIRTACMTSTAVLIGTEQGIFRKEIGSAHWTMVNAGLNSVQVNRTTAYKGVLVSLTLHGLYTSTDKGQSWTHVNPLTMCKPLRCYWLWNDSLHLSSASNEYVTGDGVTWREVDSIRKRQFDEAVVIDSLIVGYRGSSLYYATGDSALRRVNAIDRNTAVFALAADYGVLAASVSAALYVSENVRTPNKVKRAPFNVFEADYIVGLTIDDEANIYLATPYEMFRTAPPYNKFDTIQRRSTHLNRLYAVQFVNLSTFGKYILASRDSLLMLSRDKGATWLDVSYDSLIASVTRFDYTDSSLYASTLGQGVWAFDLQHIVGVEQVHIQSAYKCFAKGTETHCESGALDEHCADVRCFDLAGREVTSDSKSGVYVLYCPRCSAVRTTLDIISP